jgi:hypothetical protein
VRGVSRPRATTAAPPPNDGRSHATALGAAHAAIEGTTVGSTVVENDPRSACGWPLAALERLRPAQAATACGSPRRRGGCTSVRAAGAPGRQRVAQSPPGVRKIRQST